MSWAERAACRGMDVEVFLEKRYIADAKAVCANCGVSDECLSEAVRCNHNGVRGGTTEQERGYKSWM